MKFKLTKPWDGYAEWQPRPWRYLPWWQWRFDRHGFSFHLVRSRPVTDAEFREVILDWKLRPPEHFNCRCTPVGLN